MSARDPAAPGSFRLEVENGVAAITLDRADRLNALTFEVYRELHELFSGLAGRDDVAVVTMTGSGRAFCSGGDVDEIIGPLLAADAEARLAFTRLTGAVVEAMRRCPQPIIAAVNGVAAGAGAVLAIAADLRLLAPSASFRFLFTRVGLSGADMGAAYLLPRLVGVGRASELLLLGEPIEAQRAVDIGLASRVVDADQLLAETAALARRLADGPRLAYADTKRMLAAEQDMDLTSAIALEATEQARLLGSEDHREFHAAFTERRAPVWRGR